MSGAGPDVSALQSRAVSPGAAPSIPAPRRRWVARIGLPGFLLLAFAAILLYAARDALRPRLDVRVVPVVLKASSGVTGAVTSQAAGWVEPDPYPTYVTALTDGVVQDILVLEGEHVEAGQVVARMVADDARLMVERTAAELAAADATVLSRTAALVAAQRDWDRPYERERAIAVADAMVREAASALATLDSEIVAKGARLEEVEDQLGREERELPKGASTEFEVAKTRFIARQVRANVNSLETSRPGAEAKLERMRADLSAAKEALELRIPETLALADAKSELVRANAERERARVEHDEAKLRLERMDVRTQSAGVVSTRLAAVGTKLMLAMDAPHSAHVVHIYDPERLQVRVDVPLADSARVGVGQAARIVVEVLPDHTFEGEVTRIVHEADLQKNTLQVKVAIHDPTPDLKPEMLARVQFIAVSKGAPRSAERVFAPESLLSDRQGTRAVAWIVDPSSQEAVRREVELGGARETGWVEIASGLAPGDRLIDIDPRELTPGRAVNVLGESSAGGGASWR